MKLSFNPALINSKAQNHTLSQNTKKNNSLSSQKPIQLPGFAQVDRNMKIYNISPISFGSAANDKLLQEIENLNKEKAALTGEKVDEAVKEASKRIAKVNAWDDSAREEAAIKAAKIAGEAAKAKYIEGHGGLWKFFNGDGTDEYDYAYNSKKYELYHNPRWEINKLKENIETDKKIVELATKSAEQKQKRLNEIDSAIERIKKLISYQGLQDTVNDMLSAEGGINDRIAGYQSVKDELHTKFVDRLAKSQNEPKVEVPGCVFLYGPTGTGKTTLLNGIMDQSEKYAHVLDLSSIQDKDNFFNILKKYLDEAKERYANENKRTIILINDAEQILSINKTDAKILGVNLDSYDENMLQSYGNNSTKVAKFKSMLDDIAKVPQEGDSDDSFKSATTIFITTNYPHLISPDLLSREGKVTKIAVGLAEGSDMEAVFKFHLNKMNEVLKKIKAFKNSPDYKDAIDGLAGVTHKGRENIKQRISNKTIDMFNLNIEQMDFSKLTEALKPNKDDGAMSNDRIMYICRDAFLNYLETDPTEDNFTDCLSDMIKKKGRDINPERLKKFNLIDRMIKDPQINPLDLNNLLSQKKIGLLVGKRADLLTYQITKIKETLKSLEAQETKEPLNKEQQNKKKELEVLIQVINESENSNSESNENETDFD